MYMNIINDLKKVLGEKAVLSGDDIEPRFTCDWSGVGAQYPLAVLRPGSVDEVSVIMKICHDHNQVVVPQGGLTGLVSGATPVANSIVLNMERLNKIEEVDIQSATMTVQAGVLLGVIQEAAEDAGYFYPLDIGARDSCQIGGNISTNAGGNRVIKYGMTRNNVLGLEVVLADGRIISMLNKMEKNNTGYDLKQLFIGAEGTLGVITRAILKLSPQAHSCTTALCALPDFKSAVQLLRSGNASLPGGFSAFELMWSSFYRTMTDKIDYVSAPLESTYPLYVLLESMGSNPKDDNDAFLAFMEEEMDAGNVVDAVIAKSEKEVADIWAVRDSVAEFPDLFPNYIGFDISIPISQMEQYIESCNAGLQQHWPLATWLFFGHIGDSNLHIVVGADMYEEDVRYLINDLIYKEVKNSTGSISAEHGIGLQKKAYLKYSLTDEQLDIMRSVKGLLDPNGILNPGKIFDLEES